MASSFACRQASRQLTYHRLFPSKANISSLCSRCWVFRGPVALIHHRQRNQERPPTPHVSEVLRSDKPLWGKLLSLWYAMSLPFGPSQIQMSLTIIASQTASMASVCQYDGRPICTTSSSDGSKSAILILLRSAVSLKAAIAFLIIFFITGYPRLAVKVHWQQCIHSFIL